MSADLSSLVVLMLVGLTNPGQGQDPPGRGVALPGEPVDASSGYEDRHALVVGINDYAGTGFPTLGYAVADARAVAKILIERYGFEQENAKLLLDGDATRDAMARALEDWAGDPDRVGEEDLFVLFFAGHGETRSLGRRGSRGYLVPADGQRGEWATLVGMGDVEDISELVPAKHALFVLDCCFGGLAVTRSAPPVAAGLTSRARQVISAGTAEQTVQDSGGGGHSVFTSAFLGALEGDADLDGDGVVTFGELYNHIGREVERKTEKRQTPLQAMFPDHEGGSVALFPPGVKPGGMSPKERLKALERTAEERLDELERVSDALLVQDLIDEVDTLWPESPETIPAYRDWLGGARELRERRSQHETSVRQVRQEAYLEQVVAGLTEEGEGTEPDWGAVDAKLRWRFETFEQLLADLDVLDDLAVEIEARLEFASTVAEQSVSGAEAAEARAEVIYSVRELELEVYGGLELSPQLGLVPIGADPDSGLWEFWHVRSGSEPQRAADGRLSMTEESGLVFVLVPGGTYRRGSQSSDEQGPNYDPAAIDNVEAPVHEVDVSPFFMSKYEMAQGQWLRLTGENPGMFTEKTVSGGTLLLPVEQVDWLTSELWASRHGLSLPLEAWWEYAARAGTSTPWWTGAARETLQGAVNLADRDTGRSQQTGREPFEDWLVDGYGSTAPVDVMRPNGFGLHHTLGNVFEWCLDGPHEYPPPFRMRDPVFKTGGPLRIYRGGSFGSLAIQARASYRSVGETTYSSRFVGIRLARGITD